MDHSILIGCAGWNIPREEKSGFADTGSHLERYSTRFDAVEINSSFYRAHKKETYIRWAKTVPANFRFSVKVPKMITHIKRLVAVEAEIDKFLTEITGLEEKLGCLLVQLPPSLAFDASVAHSFFALLRLKIKAPVVFEPRHRDWFSPEAEDILRKFQVPRVRADPALFPENIRGFNEGNLAYFRLHGAPKIYYSNYGRDFLCQLADQIISIRSEGRSVWCIFDNTALGYAMANARTLIDDLRSKLE